MSEISSLSATQKLTSQIKVSMETTHKMQNIDAPTKMDEIAQFEIEMDKINHAFTLVKEIRTSLESALRDLAP